MTPPGILNPASCGPGPGTGYVQLGPGERRKQSSPASCDNQVSAGQASRRVASARGEHTVGPRPGIQGRVEDLGGVARNRSSPADDDYPAVCEQRRGVSAP